MHTHAKAKSLSELMDELLEYVPESMSSQTALSQQLIEVVHDTAMQIKKLRDPLADEKWQTVVLNKLAEAKVSPKRLRNLTYCVMYALDAKDESPLVRSLNSTFANVLLRQCAADFDRNIHELKPLIQLVYYNYDSQASLPGGIKDAELATADVLRFSNVINVDKAQIQSLELTKNALRQRSVTETIELPMNKLAQICETQLQTYRDALMTSAEESAKTASSFGVFKQAAPGKELDFKRELPIVIACLKYLKSHQEADKTAFLNLYTSVETSANFKKKMDIFFVLEQVKLVDTANNTNRHKNG